MQEGYIKLHRCLLDSSWSSHPDFVSVWVYCLLRANYKPTTFITKSGQSIPLQPGQFVTSREKISAATGVQESKVERVLKTFKSEQQIEQENKGKFRVISITNWSKYQQSEQQNEQQMNSNGTADEQQMNTDKKVKKEKNLKEESRGAFHPPSLEEVTDYCRERNRGVNPSKWHDFYTSKNWMVGKNKMKDWKAAVRTWEKDVTPTAAASTPYMTEQDRENIRRARERVANE